jgi:hypothetical protein
MLRVGGGSWGWIVRKHVHGELCGLELRLVTWGWGGVVVGGDAPSNNGCCRLPPVRGGLASLQHW